MTRKRLMAAAAGVTLAVALSTGYAAAQTDGTTTTTPGDVGSMPNGDHDGMHQQMRGQMPDELREQCDAAHGSMDGHGSMRGAGMAGHMRAATR